MAVNLVVLYRRPDDSEAFVGRFTRVHAPLIQRFPGLVAFQHGPIKPTLEGSGEWFYLAPRTCASRTQLEAALASSEGRGVRSFAGGLFEMAVPEGVPS